MTSKHAANAHAPAAERQTGLSADELRAEQAGDLPEREAMSILDVGGLHVGLPTPDDLDGVLNNVDGALNNADGALNTGDPLDGQPALGVNDPIDGGGQVPFDDLPIGTIPVEHLPTDNLPIDNPPVDSNDATVGGGLIGIPEQPAVAADTEITA